ncbi:hypothetical protein BV20DRAFT_805917 [Pilatotrama ljubarskyi]|nr:hypothetical protein BV20DRAFT_805917 [Pilatotrama ljubarskyi]
MRRSLVMRCSRTHPCSPCRGYNFYCKDSEQHPHDRNWRTTRTRFRDQVNTGVNVLTSKPGLLSAIPLASPLWHG